MLPSTIDEAATGLESITCHLPAVVGCQALGDGEQESVQDGSRRRRGPSRKIARLVPYSYQTSSLPIYCDVLGEQPRAGGQDVVRALPADVRCVARSPFLVT